MPREWIYLGFEETPYTSVLERGHIVTLRKKRRELRESRKRGFKTGKTAGTVADYLEKQYHIVDVFWAMHGDEVVDLINDIAAERLEKVLAGELNIKDTSLARMSKPAMPKIQAMFRNFLDKREMDGQEGVPTTAAINGISHWYRQERGRGQRPSFVDSGIYRAAFRAWIE